MKEATGAREEREARWRAWMIASQGGDTASYDKLLHELLPHVRRLVRRRVFDATVVEDVIQNVFLSMHRARHTYRPERPFGPWLYAITRNAVTDYARARSRRLAHERPLEDEGVAEPALEPASIDAPALAPELARALAELPAKQREAVELLHVEGLSVAEAAKRAGVSQSALKVRAHRGYRTLRTRLGDWERD